MLTLAYHGGKCCGIKTIYGFEENPDELELALTATPPTDHDILYNNVQSNMNFFHLAAPEETRLERLDRYIAYVKERRPWHIIEVALAEGSFIHQIEAWGRILKERGFKLKTSAKNSNSGNTVHIFHLVIGDQ